MSLRFAFSSRSFPMRADLPGPKASENYRWMERHRQLPTRSRKLPPRTSGKFPLRRNACSRCWRIGMREAVRKIRVTCEINGKATTIEAYPMARLLDVLREQTGLTGTKEGCGEGECGACSIEMNGVLVNSCLVPVVHADGAEIRTIEGAADGSLLNAMQQAFLTHGGAQCGICTPGMILAASNLLKRNPHPSDAEIREGLAGNLCRCTGFVRIFASVAAAAGAAESEPAKEPAMEQTHHAR